jgi:serine/threonine protein phosphatase PrpC
MLSLGTTIVHRALEPLSRKPEANDGRCFAVWRSSCFRRGTEEEAMRVHGVGLGHVGRRRKVNEDCWLADDDLGLYVVSDGMGGHRAGEVASATAVETVAQALREKRRLLERVRAGKAKAKQAAIAADEAVQEASRKVFQLATSEPERTGMGCTLTLLLLLGERGVMAHVGDSRLYLCRDGEVHQLSRDHTYVEELAGVDRIPKEALRSHPYAGTLTRAVGVQDAVQVDLLVFDVLPEDRFLLCSDGLANYVTDEVWFAQELDREDLDAIPGELVRFANESGGADNITALVVGVEADPASDPESWKRAEEWRARSRALSSCFLFKDLPLARLAQILASCQDRTFEPGQTVLDERGPCSGLWIVVKGICELSRRGEVLGELGPGDHFGVTALLSPRPARARVQAWETCRLLILSADAFHSVTSARPGLGVILMRRLAQHLAQTLDDFVEEAPGHAGLREVA